MESNINDRESTFKLIRNNSLFETASNQSLYSLLENCRIEYLCKGDCIIDNEKTLYRFYCVARGKIKVFNLNKDTDKHFTLFILSKNDVFDVFTLINNHQHNVCYEILEDAELLVFSINIMRDWLHKNPSILNSFFKYTINKFELLETHVLDLGTKGLTARLANLLLQHYNINTHQMEGINALTHDELAQCIGTTRAVLNIHIQKLKKEGIISVGRKHIEVINLKLLIEKSQIGKSMN